MTKLLLKLSVWLGAAVLIVGCGDDLPTDLEYGNINESQFLSAEVNPEGSSQRIMSFSVHDRQGDAHSATFYSNAPDLVAGHPARVGRPGATSGVQDGSVWVLVAGRFEIRLSSDDSAGSAVSVDHLTQFVETFDLRGMSSYTGAQLDGAGLVQFIPALPGRD